MSHKPDLNAFRSGSVNEFNYWNEVTRCDLSAFNFAILDFEMPGLNGRELLLRIRAMGARFPIVLLTGCLAGLSHEDSVLFARCIDKSMPIHYLINTIAEFLDPNQGPIMARERDTFRRTEPRSPFKPAARVVGSAREKRQGLSITDTRNSIGLSKAMQLVAFNAA